MVVPVQVVCELQVLRQSQGQRVIGPGGAGLWLGQQEQVAVFPRVLERRHHRVACSTETRTR